jgi:aconitase B
MKLSLFFLSAAAMVNTATAVETVDLGNAGDYVILSRTGISTVPDSSITGNMGVSPIAATAMTGFALTMDKEEKENEVDLIFSTSVQLAGRAFTLILSGQN